MYLDFQQARIYLGTGGKEFDASLPTVVFLHGSGMDHRAWQLQTRWFAFHGFSVLAPDFPVHSLSAGQALSSIEAAADWLWQLLDELKVNKISLIGHSQGALVALEAAARQAERVRSISLIATGAAIPVNEQLLQLAHNNKPAAVSAMLSWGFGEAYQFGISQVPGLAPLAMADQIMQQNPLANDLAACQAYLRGDMAAQQITAPAQLIFGQHDRMTPLKAGRALASLLPNLQSQTELAAGHMLPIEEPAACLNLLREFISPLAKQ
ncbi:MAG TPA: alpha/beta hydrolase [Thiolinea sp.]|nr:alpha/beta hydrolase [Thiolinea sp.]